MTLPTEAQLKTLSREELIALPEGFDAYVPVLAGDNETSILGFTGGVPVAPTLRVGSGARFRAALGSDGGLSK